MVIGITVLPAVARGIAWPQLGLAPGIAGFSQPTHIANAADGSARLFVVEQGGTIRIVKNGVLQSTAFLDIHTQISCCGERGLLSVAFPPGYAGKGYFYVYYTNTAGDLVIARYFVTANPDVADPNSAVIVLTVPHPINANHNGGQLAFGPDGYLYIGTGDGGSAGDPPNNAQNTNVLLGKILRIDVESGTAPYAIPNTNPYAQTSGYRPEIWAFGVRNPWRFSFDRQTHDLYIADVGQNMYEEIDFQPAGNQGGQNYGWRIMEGMHCYNAATCNMSGLTLPVFEYSHAPGDCSVTGGFVYRAPQFPRMRGIYFYGDYCTGKIWGLQRNGGTWENMLLYDAPFNITTFGEDEAGNMYLANATNGAIGMLIDLPTPSPASTATVTATLTATPTMATSAPTATPTATRSRTPSVTPTSSLSPTPTSTQTIGTPTRTPSPTLSPTSTPTPTATTAPVCGRLAPNGLASVQTQNVPAGCSDNWRCVLSNDGDSTYVSSPPTSATGPRTDLYAFDDIPPRPEPIASVNVRTVSRSLTGAASSAAAQLRVGNAATIYSGPAVATTTAYTEAVATYPTNPATGQAWSWSDMNVLQAGVRHQVANGDAVRTTQVAVDVCWVPAPASGAYSISGKILYAGSGLPVGGVTVRLIGPTPDAQQTSPTGEFAFAGLLGDAWTLEPHLSPPVKAAINAVDALAVLQGIVGTRTLDDAQRLACDVNGDGRLTAADALLILNYNVGVITAFPAAESCGSNWIFVPQAQDTTNQRITPPSYAGGACQAGSVEWAPLASQVTNQNFIAALIGDCSGSWQPAHP